MELVYLWVEGYKNIKRQGFNFSPRFICDYDEDSKELTIDENDDYIENFFGDNINITAIVGKNGSGKSNLILSILNRIYADRETKNIIFVYLKDGVTTVYQNGIPKLSTPNLEVIKLKNILNQETYSLLIDFSIGHIDFLNSTKDYKKDYSLEPSRLYQSRGGDRTKIEPTSYNMNMKVNLLYFYFYIRKNKLESVLEVFNLPNFDKLLYKKVSRNGNALKEKRINDINRHKIFDIDFSECKTSNQIEEKFSKDFSKNIIDISEEDLYKIEDLLIYVDLEMESENKLTFSHLSSGQKTLLSYIGIILRTYLRFKKTEKHTFNIYIDEFETSLHPSWQKRFLDFLVKMLESLQITNDSIVNIIITSHSPFLLSDLPKENVIFLDTYDKDENSNQEEGNCKNVTKTTDINPFGANIHTLLSDGFFMDDGLMGEFAKTKIQEIMDFLNNEKTIEEISIKENQVKKVIESIGEPFLKQKLLEMYYKKFKDEASKKARKDELLAEQKRIENELKKL